MRVPFTNIRLFERKALGQKPAPGAIPAQTPVDATRLLNIVKNWTEPSADDVRSAMTELTKLTRSYAAGAVTQYNADFVGTYGSANTEILPGKYSVRARARTLCKDTPQGKAIKRTFQDNVAGPQPFKLDMRYGSLEEVEPVKNYDAEGNEIPIPGIPKNKKPHKRFVSDEETNNAIEKFWQWFIKPENFSVDKTWGFNEATWMVVGEQVEAGGVLCREYKDYPHNEIHFALRFLEEDRLQEMFWAGNENQNKIRGSTEFDPEFGFPIAYWVLTRHPGEFMAQPTWDEEHAKTFRERIPADQIIHIKNMRDRAEQEFGMTEFDAASNAIWRNHQFNTALTLCAIASHIRAFVLEKKLPTGIEMPAELKEMFANFMANYGGNVGGPAGGAADLLNNPAQQQQGVGQRVNTLRPGEERELPFGVEAKILAPQFPTEQAHEFRLDNHREVGLAAGVSYQHASGDFQNLGFIAGLMCQIPFQLRCKIRQQHLKDNWLAKLFRDALRAAILHGWFDRRGFGFISITKLDDYCDAANFKGMRWPFVNPLIQAQTLILLMEAGMLSPQQVQDEMPDGVSIEDLYTMYAEAKGEAAQHGLDFSGSDVTRPSIQKGNPGQTTPNPNAGSQPPPKTKTSNPVRTEPFVHKRMQVDMAELLRMSTNGDH